MTEATPGTIDAHVHVWQPPTPRFPLAGGYTAEDMEPRTFTPEILLGHARSCGVERIVLIQMSYYGFDNSYMLHVMQEHPGVFSGVAVIDDTAADPAAEMRRLKAQGVRGFRLVTHNRDPGAWFDSDGIRAMWTCGAGENLAMGMLINPDVLPILGKMCARFPDTPVVIAHLARIGIGAPIRDEDVAALCRLAEQPNVKVKVSAFYLMGAATPPYHDLAPFIRRVFEAFGPGRLMWATDCPYQVAPGHTYRNSIELVKNGLDFLSGEDRDQLLRRTAEATYFNPI